MSAIVSAFVLTSCLASPPAKQIDAASGRVRADSLAEARRVSLALEELEPKLLALLPDTHLDHIEVWIQDEPRLYSFPQSSVIDAEGLWAESHGRILLARSADSLERTLAHELTHAALGDSWRMLPGSLEEGLCDRVSAELCPEGAARLRAGRLSSAALACGGLRMQLDVRRKPAALGEAAAMGWSASIVLSGEETPDDSHLNVFRVAAGLSSTRLERGAKRAYYGLSFLLIDLIVARDGFEGLQELCARAEREGLGGVPRSWLLDASGLDPNALSWREAASRSLGERELIELLRMYPDFAVDAVVGYLEDVDLPGSPADWIGDVRARLTLTEGGASVDILAVDFLRDAIEARLAEPASAE
ncbi:MAG: hypothetical protein GY711_13825 [bacterium]|nr:hypothetical protein [bacterium]